MATNAVHLSPVTRASRAEANFSAGDTVRVWQKVPEGDKFRLQAFEGIVLARKHGSESSATFTVRRIASGVGTERIFPLFSPMIDKIEIVKRARTRRAKLYYIREKAAKDVRRKMKAQQMSGEVIEDVPEPETAELTENTEAKEESKE